MLVYRVKPALSSLVLVMCTVLHWALYVVNLITVSISKL